MMTTADQSLDQKNKNRFKVLGVNDDKDFCECCGKQGLKKVVWIEDSETGKIQHFGVVCATKPAKAFNLGAEIKEGVATYESKMRCVWGMAEKLYRKNGGKYVSNGIALHLPGGALLPADKAAFDKCFIEAKAHYFPTVN